MPKVFNEEETDYVDKAMAAGTMKQGEIQFVLILNRLMQTETALNLWEIQSLWMDVKVGLNQHIARKAGIVIPEGGNNFIKKNEND